MPIFYLVSVLALVFHFANGLWTAAITWGLTVSEPAQRRWGWVCAAVGLGLAGLGAAAVLGFWTLDPESVFARCREGLEANFVPSYLQVVEQIPKTASEKPQERFLLDAFAPDAENVFRP